MPSAVRARGSSPVRRALFNPEVIAACLRSSQDPVLAASSRTRKASVPPSVRAAFDAETIEQISHAALFRAIREKLGLTQDQAASRLSYTQTNISKVEKKASANLGQIGQLIGEEYEVILVLRPKANPSLEDFRFALS